MNRITQLIILSLSFSTLLGCSEASIESNDIKKLGSGLKFSQSPLPWAGANTVNLTGSCLSPITQVQYSTDEGTSWNSSTVNCGGGSFNIGNISIPAGMNSFLVRGVVGTANLETERVYVGTTLTVKHSTAYSIITGTAGSLTVKAILRKDFRRGVL